MLGFVLQTVAKWGAEIAEGWGITKNLYYSLSFIYFIVLNPVTLYSFIYGCCIGRVYTAIKVHSIGR